MVRTRVAIVTFEFEGLTRNAGIGTAYRRLADLLVAQGHPVTVVFMPVDLESANARLLQKWRTAIRRLRRIGISVVLPEETDLRRQPGQVGYFLSRSHRVHRYLASQSFDVVHAADNCGLIYVSLQAKRAGIDFQGTRFVIGAHGPRLWTDELNQTVSPSTLLMSFFDRCSIELADSLVSPSRYMIRYLRSKGWRLPEDVRVIPNVNHLDRGHATSEKSAGTRRPSRVQTIVFFGRLETRKGVRLFADALRELLQNNPDLGTDFPLKVLFLGRDPDPDGKTISYLRHLLSPCRRRLTVRFATHLTSEQSQDLLLKTPDALVCMPSLADNSPYVVVEAIEAGLNFLASRSGGQAELVDPRDRKRALCSADSDSLARAIARRLKEPPSRFRPSREASSANLEWIRFHSRAALSGNRPTKLRARNSSSPLRVSVVPVSMNALRSAIQQDLEGFEICLPRHQGWQVPGGSGRVRFTEYEPRAGNSTARAACKAAGGEFVLFLDAALANSSTLGEWVRSFEKARASDSATVASCGIASSRAHGFSILLSGLWDRRWLLRKARKTALDPGDSLALDRFYSSLFLSGGKIGLMPKVTVVESS